MPLAINLRHLEAHNLELKGDLSVEELNLDLRDDIIRAEAPLHYALEILKLENALWLQGRLHLLLQCLCVRCLKPFAYPLQLDPWTLHLPLDGEERAVIVNDCVDLTPYLREDILLEFPQHPLCDPDCRGLKKTNAGKAKKTGGTGQIEKESSAWADLDRLKL